MYLIIWDIYILYIVKALPLRAGTDHYGSGRFEAPRIPRQTAHKGGKVVIPTTYRPPLTQKISLVLTDVRGWVNEKSQ
jgi:hypothetical protein